MFGNPDVFALLEEMLDSGRTPEEVCRDCPELLPEVRRRWKAFRLVDGSLAALFPDPETPPSTKAITAGSKSTAVNFDNKASPAKAPAASHQRGSLLSVNRTSAHAMAATKGISGTSGETLVISRP